MVLLCGLEGAPLHDRGTDCHRLPSRGPARAIPATASRLEVRPEQLEALCRRAPGAPKAESP
eukprot:14188299-Alexandrium_andersonii.AAC.1